MEPSKAVGIHARWAGAGGGTTWGSKPEQGKGGTHEVGGGPLGCQRKDLGGGQSEQGVTAEWSEAMSMREWAARAAGARMGGEGICTEGRGGCP